MKPMSLLAAVLMMLAIIGHEKNNFTEGKAETEPSNNVKVVKRVSSYTEAAVCGDTRVKLAYVRRGDSRVNDEETSDDNGDELPSLDKILGGTYATYGEIPWMATILYGNQHVCGGAIIGEFWVISAAHCFFDWETDMFTIAVGDHRLWREDSQEKTYNVENIILHEQYHSLKQRDYDIALIKIKATSDGRGIRFNDYVQPICLPDSSEIPPVGTPMLFSGWGWTSVDSGKSELLKKTILPVITYEKCKQLFRKSVTPRVFCAGYIRGDNDLCRGDSGGPAAYRSGESYILYGIANFSTNCRLPNYPTGFASVPAYRNWIDATINRYGNGSERNMPERGFTVAVITLPPGY